MRDLGQVRATPSNCHKSPLVRKASSSFASLGRLLLALTIGGQSLCSANAAEWGYRTGKGYTLCDALHKRLDKYHYPDPLQQPNTCAWSVALSYSRFEEPQWQELDPKHHRELIYRLIKYAWSSGRPATVLPQQEPFVQQEMEKFIEQGGRVQLWRTRLISDFFNKNHPERWTPPEPQNVIQLRYALSGTAKSDQAQACPDVPWVGWHGSLFIVNDTLTDIHSELGLAGNSLIKRTLVLFKGKPHFLSWSDGSSVSLGWDIGGGPGEFCSLQYNHKQHPRK